MSQEEIRDLDTYPLGFAVFCHGVVLDRVTTVQICVLGMNIREGCVMHGTYNRARYSIHQTPLSKECFP